MYFLFFLIDIIFCLFTGEYNGSVPPREYYLFGGGGHADAPLHDHHWVHGERLTGYIFAVELMAVGYLRSSQDAEGYCEWDEVCNKTDGLTELSLSKRLKTWLLLLFFI